MVCYSSTQSWYIIKINGTSFTATATKILGLEGGNTQKFKTLSLSLGQKGYNSLSFWKKNNFLRSLLIFALCPRYLSIGSPKPTLITKIRQHCSIALPLAEELLLRFASLLQNRGMFLLVTFSLIWDTIEEKLINTKMLLKGVSTCFLYLSVLTFQVPQKNGFVSHFSSISAPQWGSTTSELSGKKTRLCVAVLVLGCPLKSNCEKCAWSLRTSIP